MEALGERARGIGTRPMDWQGLAFRSGDATAGFLHFFSFQTEKGLPFWQPFFDLHATRFLFLPSIFRIPNLELNAANFVGISWRVSSYKSVVITLVLGRAS